MGFHSRNKIITDGLVYAVDPSNIKSSVSGDNTVNNLADGADGGSLAGISFSDDAWYLDGSLDYVNIDDLQTTLSSDTQGTWDMWFKPLVAAPGGGNHKHIIVFGDTDANTYMRFYQATTGALYFQAYKTGVSQVFVNTGAGAFSDNTWSHICVKADGITGPVLYFDGIAITQNLSSGANDAVWFNDLPGIDNGRVGVFNYNGQVNLGGITGWVGPIKMYNRALSADEILQNYNATKWRFK